MSDVTEVDALSRECSHGAIIIEVGTANGQILVELNFLRLFFLLVVASATKSESVRLNRGTFDVADLDGQIKSVLLCFKGPEQSENVADLVGT